MNSGSITSFRFDSAIDATSLGGAPDTVISVVFSFDAELTPGDGPLHGDPKNLASYGPLEYFRLELGEQTAIGVSGGITIMNDVGTSSIKDIYDVRSIMEGNLYGREIYSISFAIIDDDVTMFSELGLPVTSAFSFEADRQQTYLQFVDGPILSTVEFDHSARTPFTLTVVPEPTLVHLCLVAFLIAWFWSRQGASN